MDQVSLTIKKREQTGKGASRKVRREGFIPGIVYGKAISPIAVSVSAKPFELLLESKGRNIILNLEIETAKGNESITSILKDLQRDPVSDKITHLDFVNVSLTEEMVTNVPLRFIGEAAGIKDGGIFEPLLREIEVSCLPTDTPTYIEVDVSSLTIGHSLHVSDIKAPEKVKILADLHESIVTVAAPAKEEEIAVVAPVEGEAVAAEPELIRVKREEKEKEEGEK